MAGENAPLRPKDIKFIQGIIDGKSGTLSALESGYAGTERSAAVLASRKLRNPNIQRAIEEALEDKGLTISRALDELDRGLRKGKIGSHDSYLDKHLKILGLINKHDESHSTTTNNILAVGDYEKFMDAYYKAKDKKSEEKS